ncbi:MAG: YgcG family protein [Pseudomonadota bacterium]
MHSLLLPKFAGLLLLISGVLAISRPGAAELLPIPPLKARVTDLTATLSRDQAAQLESQLAAFEARKGSQIVLLMVPTTAPETIEQFSIRVAETWKPGRKGVDDGILLLVAKDDRQLRIEVGYGLEGAVNDATARRIIAETMVPRLRGNDFFGGLQAGLAQLMRVIDGEPLPEPRGEDGQPGMSPDDFQIFMPLVLGVIFLGLFLRGVIGRLLAGLLSASVAGGATWFFTQSLTAGVLMGFITLVGVALGSAGGRSGRSGGWGGGASGGYSGGGGGFGGGGSSGRW